MTASECKHAPIATYTSHLAGTETMGELKMWASICVHCYTCEVVHSLAPSPGRVRRTSFAPSCSLGMRLSTHSPGRVRRTSFSPSCSLGTRLSTHSPGRVRRTSFSPSCSLGTRLSTHSPGRVRRTSFVRQLI